MKRVPRLIRRLGKKVKQARKTKPMKKVGKVAQKRKRGKMVMETRMEKIDEIPQTFSA